jgi:regulator of replication initiation timing
MALQVSALTTVFETLLPEETRELKRKLEVSELENTRLATENADLRQGNGDAGGNLTWRSRSARLQQECMDYHEDVQELRRANRALAREVVRLRRRAQ